MKVAAAVLAAVMLASVPTYFAVARDNELKEAQRALAQTDAAMKDLTAELESSKTAYREECDELKARLDALGEERDGLEGRLEEAENALEEARAKILELSQPFYFDPDGPEYQKLYPDFYAPQPLDASQAPDKTVYLTFDDGPSARTDEILKTLENEGIKATFFIVGRTGEANKSRLKAIADAGHTVGMHSWSHDYKKIYASVEAFLDDMYKVFTLIRDETGTAPTYFRFPGGSLNSYDYGIYQDIISEMLRRGFVPCDWNMSAQDATKTPLPVEDIISNVLSAGNVARGVVLMHDSSARTTTARALPHLIEKLREKGYTFAALTPDTKPVMFNYRSIS